MWSSRYGTSPAATGSSGASERARSRAGSMSGTIEIATYAPAARCAGQSSVARGCSRSRRPGVPYAGRISSILRVRRALAPVIGTRGLRREHAFVGARAVAGLDLVEALPHRDERRDVLRGQLFVDGRGLVRRRAALDEVRLPKSLLVVARLLGH